MSRRALSTALAMWVLVVVGVFGFAPDAQAQDTKPASDAQAEVRGPLERWAGTIFLPNNVKLDFTLHVQRVQDRQTAKLSIPAQGLNLARLRDVKRDTGTLEFTLAEPNPQPAWAMFKLSVAERDAGGVVLDGPGKAGGTMTQAGQTFPVKMELLAEGEADRAGLKDGAAAATDMPGDRWEGGVDLPGGVNLGMNIRLVAAKGGVPSSGTMSIPMQGLVDGALNDVVVEPERLRFVLRAGSTEATWAKFDLKISADGANADGTMNQMGQTFPAKFRKLGAGEAVATMKRPQEPKPPFPYESQDVTFRNEKANITLAGTLTMPKGAGQFPGAVMITGSGPQDRDETLVGHKPFLVIADYLARNGVAVLRFDDRGVGKSEGNFAVATSADFAGDAKSAIAFMQTRSEIRTGGVGLIGHSEGGLVTSLVAGDPAAAGGAKAGVAWIVMLAGPGVSGSEIMIDQASRMSAPDDADAAKVKAAEDAARLAVELIVKDAPQEEVRTAVRKLVDAQVEMGGEEAKKAVGDAGGVESMTDQAMSALTSEWFRYFLKYDPGADLSRIKVPLLALNGALDMQVRPDVNLAGVDRALKAGGNADYTVLKLDGLNHLFQTAKTGKFDEYATIEETVSPTALEVMTKWIRARTGLDKK